MTRLLEGLCVEIRLDRSRPLSFVDPSGLKWGGGSGGTITPPHHPIPQGPTFRPAIPVRPTGPLPTIPKTPPGFLKPTPLQPLPPGTGIRWPGVIGVGVGISLVIRPYTEPYTDPWWHEQFTDWFPSDQPADPRCKRQWCCLARGTSQRGDGENCPDRFESIGCGDTESAASKAAKKAVNHNSPPGCWYGHQKTVRCWQQG
jgi:hypothetical protein